MRLPVIASALRGLPYVLRERRLVSGEVEAKLRLRGLARDTSASECETLAARV